MGRDSRSKLRYIISVALLIMVLFSFSAVYANGDIEYDNNGLTPTEQQGGGGEGFSWNPFDWSWGGLGNFFGDVWDGIVGGATSAWNGITNFFSNLGSMIADAWNALPDWVQDLIITIGIVLAVVVVAVVLVVAGIVSVVVAVVAVVVALIAGIIYFSLYGGTDAFNWMHATAWIFGGALIGGLAAFAITSIGLGAIWAGIKSFGGLLGGWIMRGLTSAWGGLKWLGGAIWTGIRAIGSGIAWLGGKIWAGLQWLGGAIWTGIRAVGSGIAWLGGKIWGGIAAFGRGIAWLGGKVWGGITAFGRGMAWLGGKIWGGITALGRGIAWLGGKTWAGLTRLGGAIWSGLKTAGGWAWTFLKVNVMAGVWSSVGSIGINLTKYLFGLGDFEPLAWGIDAGIAFGTGLIAGPFAGAIKGAFTSGSWIKLGGWVGAAGLVGGMGNFFLEYFTNGNWDISKFLVGGSAAILASPIGAAFSGLGSGFVGELLAGLGDFATKTGEEIVKWTYDNWLSSFFDVVLVLLSYS